MMPLMLPPAAAGAIMQDLHFMILPAHQVGKVFQYGRITTVTQRQMVRTTKTAVHLQKRRDVTLRHRKPAGVARQRRRPRRIENHRRRKQLEAAADRWAEVAVFLDAGDEGEGES